MTEKDFSLRLAKLREEKGVSARDMSLSMGQNPGYINNIESGKSMPSLSGLFYICEYLGITPKDFFDTDTASPSKANELYAIAKGLSNEQLDNLIALAKGPAEIDCRLAIRGGDANERYCKNHWPTHSELSDAEGTRVRKNLQSLPAAIPRI